MVKKYKMVKFFERRKVERDFAQRQRNGEDTSLAQKRLDYIAYYPKVSIEAWGRSIRMLNGVLTDAMM